VQQPLGGPGVVAAGAAHLATISQQRNVTLLR
jgi:hypothetical protein